MAQGHHLDPPEGNVSEEADAAMSDETLRVLELSHRTKNMLSIG